MEQNTLRKQRELTDRLNRYRSEHYNYSNLSVSDKVYDRLLDELHKLKQETGIQMSNSSTVTVGYPVAGRLEKTVHKIPLLSPDKVKSGVGLCRFMGEHQVIIILKLDGLTIKLAYENGELVEVATWGDDDKGEIATHNARTISGIPAHVQYPGRLIVTGEAFIRPSDLKHLNTPIVDKNGEIYKNGHDLAAGSVRLRNTGECMERCMTFMPFDVLEGFDDLPRRSERLKELRPPDFTPCKYLVTKRPLTQAETEDGVKQLQQYAKDSDIPIGGIVVTYNDITFSRGYGRTGYHYKDRLALKFKGKLFKTTLRSIGRVSGWIGEIAPIAISTPAGIEGCEVTRASLRNLSFIEDLELMSGNRILISKWDMIIPHMEENMDRGGFNLEAVFPYQCPCCSQPTRVHETKGRDENDKEWIIETLFCGSAACKARKSRKFAHFISKKAMDIERLFEATPEKLIGYG